MREREREGERGSENLKKQDETSSVGVTMAEVRRALAFQERSGTRVFCSCQIAGPTGCWRMFHWPRALVGRCC